MTTISAGSIALTLLQQSRTGGGAISGATPSAVDRIIDITSGKTAARVAQSAPAETRTASDTASGPRAVGGTVSSLPSAGMISAADKLAGTLGYRRDGTVDDAEFIMKGLLAVVERFNYKFDRPSDVPAPVLQVAPTYEEYRVAKARNAAESMGTLHTEEQRQAKAAWSLEHDPALFSQEDYGLRLEQVESANMHAENRFRFDQRDHALRTKLSNSASETMFIGQMRMKEFMGSAPEVTYDETGRGKVDAFQLSYGNGQVMLNYGKDGGLTTYNQDGSVRLSMTSDEVQTWHKASYGY